MLAIEEEIFQESVARGVLLVKGTWFRAEEKAASSSSADASVINGATTTTTITSHHADEPLTMFFRTTFAAVDEPKVMEAIRRFGDALRTVFRLE